MKKIYFMSLRRLKNKKADAVMPDAVIKKGKNGKKLKAAMPHIKDNAKLIILF